MDIIGGQHLRQMWDDLADVYGHKTALICESSGGVVNRYSYLELNQEINRTANLFYTLGIRKGDKVALHLDNCPEFIFCWFGLAKIGAIMVPINARLLREESAWILQNSQACLLVTSAQFYPMYQQIQQEDATAKVLEADGWLHTGDTGYCDEEGFFYFVDRRCNMIKRGGENVSCVELENIIATHPKIQDIVVVGIKDSIRDEAIKAFVVLNEGETLSEEEFFRFCEQNMAKFKVPSYLEIRKDLPRNCSGKIIRKNLK
ncbi:AMP-binding protein [Escherichia coli]